MKKILFAIASVLGIMPASAQTFELYKNGTLIGSYANDETTTYSVIVKETPAKTTPDKAEDGCYIIDGHHFVDLGLSSGLLWAETNVGATTSADDGNYYAWGETTPKTEYSWDNYNHGTSDAIKKYTGSDDKTVLETSDDAAYVNWGTSCRMPTSSEFEELLNTKNCTWTWESKTNSDGTSINGYLVTSVSNGKSIFLPASGWYNFEYQNSHGSHGGYWSSSLYTTEVSGAYSLDFYSEKAEVANNNRNYGNTIRPVAKL